MSQQRWKSEILKNRKTVATLDSMTQAQQNMAENQRLVTRLG